MFFMDVAFEFDGKNHEVASSIHPVPRICSQLQSATHWKKPAISPTFRQNHSEFRLSLVISDFHSRFLWTFFHWHSAHSAFPLSLKGALSGVCGCPNGVTAPGSHGRLATILGGQFIIISFSFLDFSKSHAPTFDRKRKTIVTN